MEINIADVNQSRFTDYINLVSFIEVFLLEKKIPFKVEVDNEYSFILTYACTNRNDELEEIE